MPRREQLSSLSLSFSLSFFSLIRFVQELLLITAKIKCESSSDVPTEEK